MDAKKKEFLKEFGKAVKATRIAKNISREELCKKIEYSMASLRNVEDGSAASKEMISRLAKALNLHVDTSGIDLHDGYGPHGSGPSPGNYTMTAVSRPLAHERPAPAFFGSPEALWAHLMANPGDALNVVYVPAAKGVLIVPRD